MDNEIRNRWLDRIGWGLIYGGLLVLIIGMVLHETEPMLGWIVVAVGGFLTLDGFVLLWLRSRLTDKAP